MSLLERLRSKIRGTSKGSADARRIVRDVMSKVEQDLKPRHEVISCIIETTLAIDQAVADQLEQRVEANAERNARHFDIRSESIYFLAHVMNRLSFAEFGPEIRRRMHDESIPQVLDIFVRAGFAQMPDNEVEDLCTQLYAELVDREAEYAQLSFPDIDLRRITKSVIGSFADIVSELVGNGELRTGLSPPSDLDAYFGTPLVVSRIVGESGLGPAVHAYGVRLMQDPAR
jgi:hypothetical protein